MIKNIIWDFDGVIFDSMKIKSDGFLELFKEDDPLSLKKMKEYHYLHGGISRFDKIRYFYTDILEKKICEDNVVILADRFSRIIEKKLLNKENLILDSLDFIEKNYKQYEFHIVSGAEHNELNYICDFFNLSKYFISINGSPIHKNIHIQNIMIKNNYNHEEIILIGDSFSDFKVAIKNKIKFYGYNNPKLSQLNYIKTFKNFTITEA